MAFDFDAACMSLGLDAEVKAHEAHDKTKGITRRRFGGG
jgi:hypothetical protein